MFVLSIFNCFNYLLFGYCSCFCFCFGFGFGMGAGRGMGVLGSVFFALPRDWAPKDLGNELGRAYNLFRGRKELAKTVATSSPLDAASINKSINYCESCSQCSQYASPLPCVTMSVSIIHTHISINIQASRFPVALLRLSDRPVPILSGTRPLLMAGTTDQFHFCASLYNNYILSAATGQRER